MSIKGKGGPNPLCRSPICKGHKLHPSDASFGMKKQCSQPKIQFLKGTRVVGLTCTSIGSKHYPIPRLRPSHFNPHLHPSAKCFIPATYVSGVTLKRPRAGICNIRYIFGFRCLKCWKLGYFSPKTNNFQLLGPSNSNNIAHIQNSLTQSPQNDTINTCSKYNASSVKNKEEDRKKGKSQSKNLAILQLYQNTGKSENRRILKNHTFS